uniref:Uncharacterized protein n=1 Tax=Geladintestivirus 1 TaxID=3233133 RepID=A0AAU8MID0_9CAUD
MEKKLPIRKDCQFLTCHTKATAKYKRTPFIIMAPIDDEIEARIDAGLDVVIHTEGYDYNVSPSKVLAYGDIDFNNNEDIDMIYHLELNIDPFSGCALPIPYYYDNHSVKVSKQGIKWFQTWDNYQIALFKHGALGKPKKIIIFKHNAN